MDVINSKKCHKHIVKNWDVFSAIPEGWHIVPEATTIPNGYQLISNGQSLFSGKRETALIEYVHNDDGMESVGLRSSNLSKYPNA